MASAGWAAKSKAGRVIFPRLHQWDAVLAMEDHARLNGRRRLQGARVASGFPSRAIPRGLGLGGGHLVSECTALTLGPYPFTGRASVNVSAGAARSLLASLALRP